MENEGPNGVRIQVSDLHKSYNGKPILRGVDLIVDPGELMVIVGGSGEGKSVLLRHIIGLELPDSGRVLLGDTDIRSYIRLSYEDKPFHVAMVFQGAALLNSLTVGENVSLHMREHGLHSEKEIERTVNHALEQVELLDAKDKLPGDLSGGMRKRAAVARALAMNPQIILYDEPTADLDPLLTEQIADLILEIKRRRGTTQVLVCHNLKLATAVADEIALLHRGRIVDRQTPRSLPRSSNPLTREFLRAATLEIG